MIKISEIIDNSGRKKRVYKNLNVGDKLKAKCKVLSKDDLGSSGLIFDYDAFIPDKIYEVKSIYMWDYSLIGYITDESGSLHIATPEIFDLV